MQRNGRGWRIGGCHHNAKLSDEDLERLQMLLDVREDLIEAKAPAGVLKQQGLTFDMLAKAFGLSRIQVWRIAKGYSRCQTPGA